MSMECPGALCAHYDSAIEGPYCPQSAVLFEKVTGEPVPEGICPVRASDWLGAAQNSPYEVREIQMDAAHRDGVMFQQEGGQA